ncbi:GNAT family N-acetyltransferase [Streptomyces sp. NPDC054950]
MCFALTRSNCAGGVSTTSRPCIGRSPSHVITCCHGCPLRPPTTGCRGKGSWPTPRNSGARGRNTTTRSPRGGVVVGSCGLHRRIGPGGLDIGYWLHHAWTGKGLATMAAAALVQAGRDLPGIDRIEIHHDAANSASGAVARRLGFTEVERVRVPGGPEAPGETGVQVRWRLQTGAEKDKWLRK